MSGRNESDRRKAHSEPSSQDTFRNGWSNPRETLAEETQRVIKEAEEEISRSIRKEFESAD